MMKVILEINDRFAIVPPQDFRRLTLKVLQTVGDKRDVRLSLSVIGDVKMRELNKQYRSLDKTTDVLAWPFSASDQSKGFIDPTSSKLLDLGEIVISYPQLQKQAQQYNCSEINELKRLFIHGFLHLLGYDHQTTRQRSRMENLEKLLIKS